MAMFHLLKIRTSIDIFKNEKCQVTFGLEYINEKPCLCSIHYMYQSRVVFIELLFALSS